VKSLSGRSGRRLVCRNERIARHRSRLAYRVMRGERSRTGGCCSCRSDERYFDFAMLRPVCAIRRRDHRVRYRTPSTSTSAQEAREACDSRREGQMDAVGQLKGPPFRAPDLTQSCHYRRSRHIPAPTPRRCRKRTYAWARNRRDLRTVDALPKLTGQVSGVCPTATRF